MATGGAWRSEYFDKPTGGPPGSRVEEALPPQATMGPQATPPAMYNVSDRSATGRGTVIVSAVLRVLTFLLTVVALGLLVAGKGTFGVQADGELVYVTRTVRFTVMGAGKYLLAACLIVAIYSLVMIALNLISLCVKALANNKIVLWITFLLDQVFAYVLISAGAAAANAVIANTKAENITGLKGTLTCANLGIDGLCSKAAASVAVTFAAFLFLAITSILSARRLFRR